MGGGKQRKETMERQSALSKQQEDLGKYFMEQSKEGLAQRKQLQAPVIDYYTKLASGDPTQIMTASAVPLGNLAKMTQQAKANIMEMAPGAARTVALGQLNREAGGQQSTLLNQAYLSAFPALQGLAAESGSTGLQTAGAGYRGVEGAASSNKDIMQIQQQQKASQLGLIGSLAGAAGSAVGGFGGLSKLFKRGGGSTAGSVSTPSGSYPMEPDTSEAFGFSPGGSVDTFRRNIFTGAAPMTSYPFNVNPAAGWFPVQQASPFQSVPSVFNYQSPQLPTTASSYSSYGK